MPEPENTQIRVFAYFMCFLVRALPKVRDQIQKHFFDKVLYNYCSKFFLERFVLSKKMDFPLYFEKVIWVGGGLFFCRNFFLKKPNTPEYAQVLVVTCPKLNSVTALLSPPPYMEGFELAADKPARSRLWRATF